MGHDCDFYIIRGNRSSQLSGYHYYISFNFSIFEKQYGWHVSMAHGHTMQTIMKQLTPIIQKLETDLKITPYQSCQYPEGADGWTPDPIVFLDHLRGLYNYCFEIVQNYPNDKVVMFSDQVWGTTPYIDQIDGYQSDGYNKKDLSDDSDDE